MALNTFKRNYRTPLHFEGLTLRWQRSIVRGLL